MKNMKAIRRPIREILLALVAFGAYSFMSVAGASANPFNELLGRWYAQGTACGVGIVFIQFNSDGTVYTATRSEMQVDRMAHRIRQLNGNVDRSINCDTDYTTTSTGKFTSDATLINISIDQGPEHIWFYSMSNGRLKMSPRIDFSQSITLARTRTVYYPRYDGWVPFGVQSVPASAAAALDAAASRQAKSISWNDFDSAYARLSQQTYLGEPLNWFKPSVSHGWKWNASGSDAENKLFIELEGESPAAGKRPRLTMLRVTVADTIGMDYERGKIYQNLLTQVFGSRAFADYQYAFPLKSVGGIGGGAFAMVGKGRLYRWRVVDGPRDTSLELSPL